MSRLASFVPVILASSLFAISCGGSSSSGVDGSVSSADAAPADAAPGALACNSLAFCSAGRVNTYRGTVATPAGGAIADGVYRLEWQVDPADSDALSGVHDKIEVIRIEGGAYVWEAGLAYRGTWSTAGTTLTMQVKAGCERGNEMGALALVETYSYSAAAGKLTLFFPLDLGDGAWVRESVFVAVTDPQELCVMAGTTPIAPGDSTQCLETTANCYCSYAIGGTLDFDSCH